MPTPVHWAGPLRSARVLRLLASLVCLGGTLGVFTVGITAYAEAEGWRGAAGWLIALNGAGALAGGIAYTTAQQARREDRRLRGLLCCFAAGYLPLLLTPRCVPAVRSCRYCADC